jgi:tRNA(His) guanylyltransferase
LMRVMDQTAISLCKQIQGAKMAFVQSDEISIIMTDFDDIKTDAWFDGNIQKIVSVSASIATVAFNNGMYLDEDILASMDKVAYFDSRVFTIPELGEVINYLIWRQQDATRNSIQMGAQSMYNQKELHGKNTDEQQEMMFQKGTNWNDYPTGFKRGRVIIKEEYTVESTNPKAKDGGIAIRTRWISSEPPVFTANKSFIVGQIRPPSKALRAFAATYTAEKLKEIDESSRCKAGPDCPCKTK